MQVCACFVTVVTAESAARLGVSVLPWKSAGCSCCRTAVLESERLAGALRRAPLPSRCQVLARPSHPCADLCVPFLAFSSSGARRMPRSVFDYQITTAKRRAAAAAAAWVRAWRLPPPRMRAPALAAAAAGRLAAALAAAAAGGDQGAAPAGVGTALEAAPRAGPRR
jgi:hypothetical protein